MGSIILVGESAHEVPDWFRTRLRHIDAALVCYYNQFRDQFVIDRCVKGSDCLSSDHRSCEKTNVMLFPHMGEAALEQLRSMDAWTKYGAAGGNDEAALLRQRRERENAKADWDAKTKESIRQDWRGGLADDKRQVQQAFDLIQRHDVARPHK